jgi:hypothetical protein
MRLHTTVFTAVLTAATLFAQEKPGEVKLHGNEQAAIIPVRTLTGESFNRLSNMLSVFNVRYQSDYKLRTILVYASPEVIAQIKKVVEELDRPGSEAAIGRNIEMTLTFLRCSTKPPSGPSTLPSDMESVAKQLRAATQYKTVEIWDAIPLRLQEGKTTEQSVRLPGSRPDAPGTATTGLIRITPEAVSTKDSGRFVRFEKLVIDLRMGNPTNGLVQFTPVSLNTAGDFKEGQKTVLGKLSGAEDETATFVVVALKVLD